MAVKRKLAQPKRGEIYLVSFDPTVGAEIQKTRPALVLQNDIANEHGSITVVAAITSQFDDRTRGWGLGVRGIKKIPAPLKGLKKSVFKQSTDDNASINDNFSDF